mmetsp:Transcript_18404/g.55437  ORF Transcript_18404/g.55437 Transcript_18404/m.55437 type:complete len:297 (+) Transcript_18404:6149-7039(+)
MPSAACTAGQPLLRCQPVRLPPSLTLTGNSWPFKSIAAATVDAADFACDKVCSCSRSAAYGGIGSSLERALGTRHRTLLFGPSQHQEKLPVASSPSTRFSCATTGGGGGGCGCGAAAENVSSSGEVSCRICADGMCDESCWCDCARLASRAATSALDSASGMLGRSGYMCSSGLRPLGRCMVMYSGAPGFSCGISSMMVRKPVATLASPRAVTRTEPATWTPVGATRVKGCVCSSFQGSFTSLGTVTSSLYVSPLARKIQQDTLPAMMGAGATVAAAPAGVLPTDGAAAAAELTGG